MRRWYLNDSDYDTVEDIVQKGNVGDIITYSPDNQQGTAIYKIKLNEAGHKYAEQIGDMHGLYDDDDDDENRLEQQEGGKRKGKKRARKTNRNKTKKSGRKTRRVRLRRTLRRK
jgi:hypothetical protein